MGTESRLAPEDAGLHSTYKGTLFALVVDHMLLAPLVAGHMLLAPVADQLEEEGNWDNVTFVVVGRT